MFSWHGPLLLTHCWDSFGTYFEAFMYRINNELVLNSQNESTYLEGPLGPERGWFILIIQYERVVYHT